MSIGTNGTVPGQLNFGPGHPDGTGQDTTL